MMQLAFRTPPAFHLQPFVAEPSRARRGGWALYLGMALLVAALLNLGFVLGARSMRSADGGITAGLGDWLAGLDQPELSQSTLGASQ
jgi:hypothetical protein